jgi:Cwf15/Cwc15 cell cycle control protein
MDLLPQLLRCICMALQRLQSIRLWRLCPCSQEGQNTAKEQGRRDLKAELLAKERKHFGKKASQQFEGQAAAAHVNLCCCTACRDAQQSIITAASAFSKPLLTEARHFLIAEERQEDLKLLESTASVEDGKPAKMLVPKAIDADDADSGSEDDSDDDDESVRLGPTSSATNCCTSLPFPVQLDFAAVVKASLRVVGAAQVATLSGMLMRWGHQAVVWGFVAGRRGTAAGGASAHKGGARGGGRQGRSRGRQEGGGRCSGRGGVPSRPGNRVRMHHHAISSFAGYSVQDVHIHTTHQHYSCKMCSCSSRCCLQQVSWDFTRKAIPAAGATREPAGAVGARPGAQLWRETAVGRRCGVQESGPRRAQKAAALHQ